MATVDITDVRPSGNSFAEGRLNPPDEIWAPPLAPNGTTAAGRDLLREETFRPVAGGEDSLNLRLLSSLLSQIIHTKQIHPKRLEPAES